MNTMHQRLDAHELIYKVQRIQHNEYNEKNPRHRMYEKRIHQSGHFLFSLGLSHFCPFDF